MFNSTTLIGKDVVRIEIFSTEWKSVQTGNRTPDISLVGKQRREGGGGVFSEFYGSLIQTY